MKFTRIIVSATTLVFLLVNLVVPVFSALIPADKAAIPGWMSTTLVPNRVTLAPELLAAEKSPIIIHVRQDGTGQFKTISEAVNSVPLTNNVRTIIWIGPGVYNEKVTVNVTQDFITFYGTPGPDLPLVTFNGTAATYGTDGSATMTVLANYFMAVNLIFENSAPEPDGKNTNEQAVACRIWGDKTAFYNCRFLGFQDTLDDDKGSHFFKDCFIQGTVDFIFGDGKSLFLATEMHSISKQFAVIAAQDRHNETEDTGFAFVHCLITGTPNTFLGRGWMPFSKVVYIYTDMGSVVSSVGWEHMGSAPDKPDSSDKTVFFGEFQNIGPSANLAGRAPYVKQLTADEANIFLDISYINGTSWLLPPPTPK